MRAKHLVRIPVPLLALALALAAVVPLSAAAKQNDFPPTVRTDAAPRSASPYDYVDLGDSASEQAHNLSASPSSSTSVEAGRTRRYAGFGVANAYGNDFFASPPAAPPPGPWDAFNLAPAGRTVAPVAVYTTTGTVTNAGGVLTGGTSTITGTGSSVTLDFGKEVGGFVSLHFASGTSAGQTVGLTYSEWSTYVSTTTSDGSNGGSNTEPPVQYAVTPGGGVDTQTAVPTAGAGTNTSTTLAASALAGATTVQVASSTLLGAIKAHPNSPDLLT